jgi:hypothetical protein
MRIHEPLEGFRLLDGGQILALKVLDQRNLGVVAFNVDRGQNKESRLLGRLIAPLARASERSLTRLRENRI